MRSLLRAIHTGASQVVSITGFGGVGKSRLAAALARESQRTLRMPWLWLRTAGAWEPVTGSPVGKAFTRWNQGLIDGQPEAAEELAQMIAERPFLIIVDDAPGAGSPLDAALLQMIVWCPRLRIVETTRRPQHQSGRCIVPLKPLHVPVLDMVMPRHLGEHPVLQLFLPLVRAAQPDFEESQENLRHVLDVCRSLDGLPLALEAAARWFACYPPALVADAARDDPGILAAPSDGASPKNWLREAIDDALGCLTGRQLDLLFRLAARIAPWTCEELAVEMPLMSTDLTESIHALLAVGLIRSVHAGGQAFTVLNVVRSALVSTPS
jgi:predicted ATPase